MFSNQRRHSGLMDLAGALVAALALVVGTAAVVDRYQHAVPGDAAAPARCEVVCRTVHAPEMAGNNG